MADVQTWGVEIEACGDGQCHSTGVGAFGSDVEVGFDHGSVTLTLHLDENDLTELYWWLLEVIPQLRKDRR
jgi:hypothetical protein